MSARQTIVACLAALSLLFGCRDEPVTIHVAFKLTDDDYRPIAGRSFRVVVGVPDWGAEDWRASDVGVRVVTGRDGTAHFTTTGVVDRRWQWEPLGFTPLSIPIRVDHAGIGFEAARVLPGKTGDVTHHWFYTADVSRLADGTASSYDIDRIYEAGPDKRFTRLLVIGASSPNAVMLVGGMALTGSGFRLADFALGPAGNDNKVWNMRLVLKEMPKPALR